MEGSAPGPWDTGLQGSHRTLWVLRTCPQLRQPIQCSGKISALRVQKAWFQLHFHEMSHFLGPVSSSTRLLFWVIRSLEAERLLKLEISQRTAARKSSLYSQKGLMNKRKNKKAACSWKKVVERQNAHFQVAFFLSSSLAKARARSD